MLDDLFYKKREKNSILFSCMVTKQVVHPRFVILSNCCPSCKRRVFSGGGVKQYTSHFVASKAVIREPRILFKFVGMNNLLVRFS